VEKLGCNGCETTARQAKAKIRGEENLIRNSRTQEENKEIL
jgi:hypothetical protein